MRACACMFVQDGRICRLRHSLLNAEDENASRFVPLGIRHAFLHTFCYYWSELLVLWLYEEEGGGGGV